MKLYAFFDAVRYCFCKLYKVRHFSGLSFVSQIVKCQITIIGKENKNTGIGHRACP